MSVKYPVGVEHGDRVRLLRDVKTKGGDVFPAGMVMIVGEATRSRNGRHGRPRVSLWDPERPCWNEKTQEAARGVRGVERSAYEPIRSENMKCKNGVRVRVKIPGHRTYGTVVETVGEYTRPSATPDRFYTMARSWSSTNTETMSASETILVRVEVDAGKTPPLYRVLPSMLEAA